MTKSKKIINLTLDDLKELGVIKKKRKNKRRHTIPSRAVQGIRSTSDHLKGWGTQINRSNDLSNKLAEMAIEKEEKRKSDEKEEKVKSAQMIANYPTYADYENKFKLLTTYLQNERNENNNRFNALGSPSFNVNYEDNEGVGPVNEGSNSFIDHWHPNPQFRNIQAAKESLVEELPVEPEDDGNIDKFYDTYEPEEIINFQSEKPTPNPSPRIDTIITHGKSFFDSLKSAISPTTAKEDTPVQEEKEDTPVKKEGKRTITTEEKEKFKPTTKHLGAKIKGLTVEETQKRKLDLRSELHYYYDVPEKQLMKMGYPELLKLYEEKKQNE